MMMKNEQNNFTDNEISVMKDTAKMAVESLIKNQPFKKVNDIPEALKKNLACFVTLYKDNELRGCIGTIETSESLYENIISNAQAAASRDYRFTPVKKSELEALEYEISVLSEPQRIYPESLEEMFGIIKNKGVIIRQGIRSSVYLPQVWNKVRDEIQFMESLCEKAGLNENTYKDIKSLEIYIFENLI